MGAEHKKLGVPGEEELGGRGVSYCATCDAAFYKDRTTIIVGGGDSAMEEAIFLAKFSSKVTIVQPPRRVPRLEDHARARAEDREHRVPDAVHRQGLPGRREGRSWTAPTCINTETGEELVLPMAGAFIAIGHEPQSEIVDGLVDVDDEGYVKVDGRSTRTNLPGVFAAGDLVDHTYRQAITASGSGCQAALDAEWYLRDNPAVPTPKALEGTGNLAEEQWAPVGPLVAALAAAALVTGCGGDDEPAASTLPTAPDTIKFSSPNIKDGAAIPAAQHLRRRRQAADDRLA